MKILISALLALTVSQMAFGNTTYSSNDGVSSPGNFSSKSTEVSESTSTSSIEKEEVSPSSMSETGVNNGSGITTERMNTSTNPAPATDKEVIDNTTLSKDQDLKTGPFTKKTEYNYKKEVQSQEETPLDYSTTPEKTENLED